MEKPGIGMIGKCSCVWCKRRAVMEGFRVDQRREWQRWEPFCEKHFAALVGQERMLGRTLEEGRSKEKEGGSGRGL